jgi:hypothetical protein
MKKIYPQQRIKDIAWEEPNEFEYEELTAKEESYNPYYITQSKLIKIKEITGIKSYNTESSNSNEVKETAYYTFFVFLEDNTYFTTKFKLNLNARVSLNYLIGEKSSYNIKKSTALSEVFIKYSGISNHELAKLHREYLENPKNFEKKITECFNECLKGKELYLNLDKGTQYKKLYSKEYYELNKEALSTENEGTFDFD